MESSIALNRDIFTRALHVLPGGVSSPIRSWKELPLSPFVPARGKGAQLVDIEGKIYIDYCMSFGALILGHAHPKPSLAAAGALMRGSTYGLTTATEVQLAEFIVKHTFCEQVRFVSSGTEALSTIIRIARGVTKRPLVVKFEGNYHGHIDALLLEAGSYASELTATPSAGITRSSVCDTIALPYNDEEAACRVFSSPELASRIALVLIEPVAGNMGVVPAKLSFLEYLRKQTRTIGALLCFDEVISGFRVHPQGASGLYGVIPDLVAYGKIVGGGFPAACVGGSKTIMEELAPLGEVFQAGTLSGNPVALAAGAATLQEIFQPGTYEKLEAKTAFLLDPIERILQDTPHSLVRVGSMFSLFFYEKYPRKKPAFLPKSRTAFAQFFQELLQEGIYFSPALTESQFVSMAHTEQDLLKTRDVLIEALSRLDV
ncbi:MAG: glutamate-1-semialdehyde 2,1-aminomutase [Chlamydiota bacterium]